MERPDGTARMTAIAIRFTEPTSDLGTEFYHAAAIDRRARVPAWPCYKDRTMPRRIDREDLASDAIAWGTFIGNDGMNRRIEVPLHDSPGEERLPGKNCLGGAAASASSPLENREARGRGTRAPRAVSPLTTRRPLSSRRDLSSSGTRGFRLWPGRSSAGRFSDGSTASFAAAVLPARRTSPSSRRGHEP